MRLPPGTLPERELLRTSRTERPGTRASFPGMEPKSWLKLRSRRESRVKSPRLAGMAPARLLD